MLDCLPSPNSCTNNSFEPSNTQSLMTKVETQCLSNTDNFILFPCFSQNNTTPQRSGFFVLGCLAVCSILKGIFVQKLFQIYTGEKPVRSRKSLKSGREREGNSHVSDLAGFICWNETRLFPFFSFFLSFVLFFFLNIAGFLPSNHPSFEVMQQDVYCCLHD
jgi:hypothetical protein